MKPLRECFSLMYLVLNLAETNNPPGSALIDLLTGPQRQL